MRLLVGIRVPAIFSLRSRRANTLILDGYKRVDTIAVTVKLLALIFLSTKRFRIRVAPCRASLARSGRALRQVNFWGFEHSEFVREFYSTVRTASAGRNQRFLHRTAGHGHSERQCPDDVLHIVITYVCLDAGTKLPHGAH